jgi:predicted dithiol-disulfide oxidoreductase (DUF899 family)
MNPPQVISAQEWQAARDALLVPYGRQEQWEDSPEGWPQDPTMSWLRPHDEY